MSTQTQFKTSTLNANLAQLPILKHFDKTEIATQIDSFRKGEKGIFWFLKLAALVGVGYLTWVYVLPPIFQAIGQFMAVAATGVLIVFGIMCAPLIVKGLRKLTRAIHKTIIKHDPFGQLEEEKTKMLENQQTFRVAKGGIDKLKTEMEIEAERAQTDAEEGQKIVLKLQGKAARIKADMDAMVNKLGVAAKGEDEYVSLAGEFQKVNAEAMRVVNKMQQSASFVQKYGTRASVMKKMSQKLSMVEIAMDIKIEDFNATIEMLKKDYAFGQKSNQATSAAKSAMLFSKGWEFDYALDVITQTISADIATTSGNLKDINLLTANYELDSDDLFANLNEIADKIKVGAIEIPEANKYSNPEYKLTQSDVKQSGGFGEMF